MPSKLIEGKIASLDVDSQFGFTPLCPDELPTHDGQTIVDELNLQAQYSDLRVGSKDAHPANSIWLADDAHPPFTPIEGKHVDLRWPKHCVPGTKGFELLKGLPHPGDYDFFVWKGVEPDMHPYGACFHDLENKLSTGLIEFLKQNDVELVVVGGLATDYCVKNSVLQLLSAGFNVIVNKAAIKGVDPDTSLTAMRLMKDNGAMFVESANEIKALLKEEHDTHHHIKP